MTAHGPVRTDRRNPLQRLIKRAKSPSWVGMKQEKLQGAGQKNRVCTHGLHSCSCVLARRQGSAIATLVWKSGPKADSENA